MAPKNKLPPIILPPNLSADNITPFVQLLHLTIYRNKNQHRLTKWWASLTLLTRNLKRLLTLLESPDIQFRKNKEKVLKLVEFLKEQVIPRAYLGFSGLVSDGQFANVGLLLLGCLGRLSWAVRMPGEEVVEAEEEEVREVEEEMAGRRGVVVGEDLGETITREGEDKVMEELGVLEERKGEKKRQKRRAAGEDDETEVGESREAEVEVVVRSRKPKRPVLDDLEEEREASPVPKKRTKKSVEKAVPGKVKPEKKKKKKKGGDDFDDLFSGLV